MSIELIAYLMGLGGMWILCDGWFSWSLYYNAPRTDGKQTFWRDHYIRLIRIIIGIAMMFGGWQLLNA